MTGSASSGCLPGSCSLSREGIHPDPDKSPGPLLAAAPASTFICVQRHQARSQILNSKSNCSCAADSGRSTNWFFRCFSFKSNSSFQQVLTRLKKRFGLHAPTWAFFHRASLCPGLRSVWYSLYVYTEGNAGYLRLSDHSSPGDCKWKGADTRWFLIYNHKNDWHVEHWPGCRQRPATAFVFSILETCVG